MMNESAFSIHHSALFSMEIKKGIGVSPGVVIGTAVVLDAEDLVVPRRQVPAGEADAEVERLGKVIAHDMLPSQTAALDKLHVRGFATDVGGRTSHTAIVARAMGIPAVVGLGDITGEISGGDAVIIDGNRGVVIINPDAEQLAEHRELEKKQVKLETELKSL